MPDADALVEDEAASVPAALRLGDLFQIGEDAAFQVNDVGDALAFQVGVRFVAADAAGAEHRDALAGEFGGMVAPPGGEVAEALRMRVHRAGEPAVADLATVSGGVETRVKWKKGGWG